MTTLINYIQAAIHIHTYIHTIIPMVQDWQGYLFCDFFFLRKIFKEALVVILYGVIGHMKNLTGVWVILYRTKISLH